MEQEQRHSSELTVKEFVEAGGHFGHQKNRWNPKMKRYIFGLRHGIYIIDLAKTIQLLRKACVAIKEIVGNHKAILFVGTKKQAKTVIKECATACGERYVCERWRGGTLTNLTTIRNSIRTLERIEKRLSIGGEGLNKKELVGLEKRKQKLDRDLSGIREMRKLPGAVVVVDPNQEHLAVTEANKLGIPVFALADTNCNPDLVQWIIPCNDDALKSVRIVIKRLAEAIIEKKREMHQDPNKPTQDESNVPAEANDKKIEEEVST